MCLVCLLDWITRELYYIIRRYTNIVYYYYYYYNPEQLDAVALHERVRKLESDHHTRYVISELQSKRCDEFENKITELSKSLLQHANSIKTLESTYASVSNSVNKNRHIVKHSTDSTHDASTAEHVRSKQTVNKLSRSAANENVNATPSPSVQQEDDEGAFRIPREHVRKQQRQDKRRNILYMVLLKVGILLVDCLV